MNGRFSPRVIEKLAIAGLFRYTALVGEVIFDMAFDSAMRLHKDQQPLGGREVFFTAVTLSVLTSGMLGSLGTRSGHIFGLQHERVCLALRFTALGLSLSQVVIRMPVLLANRA